jgi:Fe(3+) dicitrate transport protein
MKSAVFNIVILCLLFTEASAQYRLSGSIVSAEDSTGIRDCIVYANKEEKSAVTDSRGRFLFDDLPNGTYLLHVTSLEFEYAQVSVTISDQDEAVRVWLSPRTTTLAEVMITDAQSSFGFNRMRSVETMGIYEGKKSEVIVPEQLVANLATNNARQVYSRVAGLNIWENDGAGLQLSIGGRGLDPSRTSNFNVRQNGYDISADALGYPESYYTPPVEGIGKIQIVRGAASLQYGTQFGGIINFKMKAPAADKKLEILSRQTMGSFGFYNFFTSASGTSEKVSYYSFFQYKRGDGWRRNSEFDNHTFYANVNYAVNPRTKIGIDITDMGYLAQQPGGLTDEMFRNNPKQTNRARNWFKVNWNLFALHLDHKFNSSNEFNLRLFGLSASRYSIGFRPNRVATIDDNSERDLIKGNFANWGAEARYLKRYSVADMPAVVLAGARYYQGNNHSTQGAGSTSAEPEFHYPNGDQYITYDYRFPNQNLSFFVEHIFYLTERLSLTPGVRYENIYTTAEGYYGTLYKDLAGNIIDANKTSENRHSGRQFVIAGLGVSYKPTFFVEVYGNISQNYRSITFSDMRIANPSSVIDPDLKDEKGYSLDAGVRSDQTTVINYDVSVFYLNYNNRIGEIQFYDEHNRVLRKRSNIGQAIIQGLEAYAEADVLNLCYPIQDLWSGVVFVNLALIHSRYKASETPGIKGNEVEFVPRINLKSGIRLGYKQVKASFQYTYLSSQFSDATNSGDGGVSAVVGTIPAYDVMDVSVSYQFKNWRLEGSINNVADAMYFTRRATGYPGPGILPSDGRSFYLTLQLKI